MHYGIALLIVAGVASSAAASEQNKTAPGAGRINACSLLPRELVAKVTTVANKLVLDMPPEEAPIGQKGSSCEYADIGLQIDPFARPDELRKSPGKEWLPVTGVGDTAFFRSNRNYFAELMVWTGTHHFTIQMGVPTGGTAENIKPNTIALAQAIIPKLK